MLRSDDSASFVENQPPTDYFQIIPAEISLAIFQYLDNQGLRALWATSRLNKTNVETYGLNQMYFAVGKPLSLTDYGSAVVASSYGQGLGTQRTRAGVSAYEVSDAITYRSQRLLLFKSLAQAERFRLDQTQEFYDRRFDVYYTTDIPAIYVVSVKHRWKLKAVTLTLNNAARQIRNEVLQVASTRNNNVARVHVAAFQSSSLSQLFFSRERVDSKDDFSESIAVIWDRCFAKQRGNLDQKILAACVGLFQSYSHAFLSSIFRHQQKNVKNILDDLGQLKPNAQALLEYVDSLIKLEEANPRVNKKGDYFSMIIFVKQKIESLRELQQLPEAARLLRLS